MVMWSPSSDTLATDSLVSECCFGMTALQTRTLGTLAEGMQHVLCASTAEGLCTWPPPDLALPTHCLSVLSLHESQPPTKRVVFVSFSTQSHPSGSLADP